MAGDAWNSFYWGDYLRDTMHLSPLQHGMYLLLMAHYYSKGKPIPANAEQVHCICRCRTDADERASMSVLAEFFSLEGDVYRHKRIDREIAKSSDISTKRRNAALSRYSKRDANDPANDPASAEHLDIHSHSHSQEEGKPLVESVDPLPEDDPPADDHAFPDEVMWIANELANLILANNPKNRELQDPKRDGTVLRWARDIDKMIRLDGRSPRDVAQAVRWCQRDSFWSQNILSGKKLREQYDTLFLKMNAKGSLVTTGHKPSRMDRNIEAAREFIGGGE